MRSLGIQRIKHVGTWDGKLCYSNTEIQKFERILNQQVGILHLVNYEFTLTL